MDPAFSFDVDVTAESEARWRMARDGTIAQGSHKTLPLSYFVFLRAQPILGRSIHAMLGRDPDRGLYGGARYRLQRRPQIGMRLTAQSAVRDRKQVETERGIITITTLDTTYHHSSETCLIETVRMIDLPLAPAAGASRAVGPEPTEALPKLIDVPPFARRQMSWMAVETGDMNHLHFDPVYARGRGFKDVVVPAPLITAKLEQLISRHADHPVTELDIRFHAPTFPDEPLVLHGHVENEGVAFELVGDGTLRAAGSMRWASALEGGV